MLVIKHTISTACNKFLGSTCVGYFEPTYPKHPSPHMNFFHAMYFTDEQ